MAMTEAQCSMSLEGQALKEAGEPARPELAYFLEVSTFCPVLVELVPFPAGL